MLALLHHPEERRRLREDASIQKSAIEELLRYDSPIQITDRVAGEDMELAGRRMKKGDVVGLILASANRDPAHFDQPDRLDLARADNAHMAFGHGVHFCLGAQLARLEGQVAIRALLERFPDLDGDRHPKAWKRSLVLRGLTSLPVRLHSAARSTSIPSAAAS